jgi:ATP-binding cassette subfamily C protein
MKGIHNEINFAEESSVDEVGGNTVIVLNGTLRAWLVESGYVDVFFVRCEGEVPTSRRTFIRRFGESAILFAGSPRDSQYALVGTPAARTRLREIEAASLQDSSYRHEHSEMLSSAIDEWVEGISEGVFDAIPPKQHVEPNSDGPFWVEGGTPCRSTNGLVWLDHLEGTSMLVGRSDLAISHQAEFSAPVGAHVWIEPAEACRLLMSVTSGRLRTGGIWDDMRGFHALVHGAIMANEAESRRQDALRLERKSEVDRKVLTNAVRHLANVMSDRSSAASAEGDPLFAVCQIVGEAIGVEIRKPADASSTESRGRLERIASASRIRTRRVALRGDWWRRDAGPLLAVQTADKGASHVPVALLPETGRGYRLINPQRGMPVEVDVDKAVANRLTPFAYSFYRPFHDRAINAWEVFRFGAEGCRSDFAMILCMGLAGGILGLLTPIITGAVFNTVIPGAERIQLLHFIVALLVCAVANALFQLVRGYAVLRIESKMDASVQSAVWDRLLNLPTTFFRRFAAGDLAVRAGGISEIRRLFSGATISSLLSGLFSIFNLALLFYYDAGLALCACGMTLTALSVMIAAGYAQLRFQRKVAAVQSRLSGQVLQFITGITKLRVAGAEAKAYERWAAEFADQRRLQFKARRVGNGLTTFNAVFSVLSMMVIFGVTIANEDALMTTGDFIAFSGAYGAFTSNLLAMTGAFVAVMMAIPIYEQARPILEACPEVNESKMSPGPLSGEIEISQVTFRYDPDSAAVIDRVSLRARPGEFIAIVGPSGSGKSTILRLLLGFEHPESGSIYFDGQDVSGLDIQAVRRQIGVVLQNGSVMTGDLFTNIIGSSLAAMDDAWEAARMAGLDEDIRQMPMGMHTVISEGGTTLSGGQRQRLLIARAVVNRPRLLFFDEATSALDNRTQAIVSESLERLQATRIVVAHRLSTIMNADCIYVLDGGRVVQTGSYASLRSEGGVFTELIRRQMT